MADEIHDFAGIGIGPFNLSLACLSAPLDDLAGVFFDRKPGFDWHPGLMLPHARMQTPYPADLVTLADPTSPFSFLNFLKQQGRIHSFLIRDDHYLPRREFNQYCQWCAEQLPNLHFGLEVTGLEHVQRGGHFRIRCLDTADNRTHEWRARRLVIGTGSRPWWPPDVPRDHPRIVHAAHYVEHREQLHERDAITVVGGGQSGAEIFLDLLESRGNDDRSLTWITRAPHFFPTEESRFSLELSTSDYVDFFHGLPAPDRDSLLGQQYNLHKGARLDTLNRIHDVLYERRVAGCRGIRLRPDTTLAAVVPDPATGQLHMTLRHGRGGRRYAQTAEAVILATGYAQHIPEALAGIADRIRHDGEGRFAVDRNYAVDHRGEEIFLHNGDQHSHGFAAFDIGLACHRNSRIINAMSGRIRYRLDENTAFQEFDTPECAQQP